MSGMCALLQEARIHWMDRSDGGHPAAVVNLHGAHQTRTSHDVGFPGIEKGASECIGDIGAANDKLRRGTDTLRRDTHGSKRV